jgi:hypothetical protein
MEKLPEKKLLLFTRLAQGCPQFFMVIPTFSHGHTQFKKNKHACPV